MPQTQTYANVKTITRVQAIANIAKSFIDVSTDRGTNNDFYYDRMDVMMNLQLVTGFDIVIMHNGEAIGGAELHIDWEKHTAMVEGHGEFMADGVMDQYGSNQNIRDMIDVVRRYVDRMCEHYTGAQPSIWYTISGKKIRELGRDRVEQLLDSKKDPEAQQETSLKWANIAKARANKTSRTSTFADVSEAKIKAW